MTRSIPIIHFKNLLLVSIQIELSDDLVVQLRDDLAMEMASENINGLVIEVSGIELFDSYIACSVRDIAHVARLMGVETILAGLDSTLAITLVEMGMDMSGLHTTLNLDEAVDKLNAMAKSTIEDQDLLEEDDLSLDGLQLEDDDWFFGGEA